MVFRSGCCLLIVNWFNTGCFIITLAIKNCASIAVHEMPHLIRSNGCRGFNFIVTIGDGRQLVITPCISPVRHETGWLSQVTTAIT